MLRPRLRPTESFAILPGPRQAGSRYPAGMREDLLKRFFVGDEAVDRLAEDVSDAATRIDPVHSTIRITDMEGTFTLTCEHIMLRCDATLSKTLTADALTTIVFALLASDHFEWSDDVISEVLQDWSCPEINFPWSTAY